MYGRTPEKKPYLREVCMKFFAGNGALTIHIRMHTGEKTVFVREVCMKAFAVSGALRTHTGEKPHSNEVRTKSFAVNGALKTDIRTHTPEKTRIRVKYA